MRNIYIGILCQILNAGLGFIVRYFFIKKLGVEYLGVNGLFSDVLQFLSLVELGVGNAIIYRLYAPLKKGNIAELKALIHLYKNAYLFIGIVVLVLGLLLTPFITWLVKDTPQIDENLYIVYVLFVINSAISYFCVYKQSLIIADQKNYIVTIIRQVVKLIQSICQILILVFTKNFILFLLIGISFVLLTNIAISWKADKLYPFLKGGKTLKLDVTKRKGLFSDIKSILLFKLGYVLLNNSNSIIISLFLGITYVGFSSNYFLITAALEFIITQFSNAFSASIGNFNVDANSEEKWRLYNLLSIIIIVFCGLIYSGMLFFSNDFLSLWIGDAYSLSTFSVFSIVLFMFLKNTGVVGFMFRTSQGAFAPMRFAPMVIACFHILVAIILVKFVGFPGVYISVSCAILCLNIYDEFVISRVSGFNFLRCVGLNIILWIVIVVLSFIGFYCSDFIIESDNTWKTFVLRIFLYSILFVVFGHTVFYMTNRYYKEFINNLLRFRSSF